MTSSFTPRSAQHVDIKAFETGQQFFTVVCQASGVQYGK
jgi:hypothetical protein